MKTIFLDRSVTIPLNIDRVSRVEPKYESWPFQRREFWVARNSDETISEDILEFIRQRNIKEIPRDDGDS